MSIFHAKCFSLMVTILALSVGFSTQKSTIAQEPNKPATEPEKLGADTAGQCVEMFFSSILDGDQEKMAQVALCRTKLDRIEIQTIVRFGSAADRFRTKFVEFYGRDAWERFNDNDHLPHKKGAATGANGSLTVMKRSEIPKLVKAATKNSTETKSWATVPNTNQKLELVVLNGRWFVKSETLAGQADPEENRVTTNTLGLLAVETERFYHAIGLEGVTPDDIDFEFGASSLVVLGMKDFKAFRGVKRRFDIEQLPEPEPFKTLGEVATLSMPDLSALNLYAKKGETFINTFLNQAPEKFIAQLAPEIRPYISPDRIRIAAESIKSKFSSNIEFTDVNFRPKSAAISSDIGSGYVATGKLGNDEQQAKVDIYELDGKWVGIKVESETFGFDSRTLSAKTDAFYELHAQYMKDCFNQKIESAWRSFSSGDEPAGEKFEYFKNGLERFNKARPAGFNWNKSDQLASRIVIEDGELMVRTIGFHRLVKGTDDLRFQCMTEVLLDEAMTFNSYNIGTLDDNFLLCEFQPHKEFLRALGEGSGLEFLAQRSSFDMSSVHTSVANAYFDQFCETYGSFKGIDASEFKIQALLDASSPGVKNKGQSVFENGELVVKADFSFGELSSFGTEKTSIEMMSYPSRIQDKTELDLFSQKFLKLALSKDPTGMLDMADPSLQEQIGTPKKWADSTADFRSSNGPVKSVRLLGSEYSKDTRLMKFDYELECENRILTANVNLTFGALAASVLNLNIRIKEQPPAEEKSEENTADQ